MDKTTKLQILRELLQINSVNGNEVAVARYLQALFTQYGLTAKVDEFGNQRANLILEVGSGDRVLGVTGHMDTVAVGDKAAWHHPPFGATVIGDKVYARGAADMKSGLAAQAIALIELAQAGAFPGHVRFLATAGEEFGTPGANRLAAQGQATDLAALLVGEGTSGNVVYAHAGSINYRLTSQGKAAHSSTPERGINALAPLVSFFAKEQHLFDEAAVDPLLGPVKHSVTVIKGGEQVNSIPATAELLGNVRPTKAVPNQVVIERLQRLAAQLDAATPGISLELEVLHDFYPVASAPTGAFAQLALTAAKQAFATLPGRPVPTLETINGATDASVFAKVNPDLPVVVLGPDAWECSHQVNEWTTISSYLAVIEAYKTLITNFANA